MPATSRKFCTFARIGHTRDKKPEAEDETGDHINGHAHGQLPTTCRITSTVAIPVQMKIAVAMSERSDSRANPQTPFLMLACAV